MASRKWVVDSKADRVLVVANPTAGARSRQQSIADLVECLADSRLAVQMVHDLAQLEPLIARHQASGRLRAVVAAGGDGTIAELVNRTNVSVPITVFPLGTANLLAGYFRITADPVQLTRIIREGHCARLDAGCANGRIFLLMAGCGFDAEVVERLHKRRDGGHISYWTYARPIVEALRHYRYPNLRVFCESSQSSELAPVTLTARWAFVVNVPCYAGGLQFALNAVGTDGMLNVCTFENGSLWHALKYLGYVVLRQHPTLSDFRTESVVRVRIEADEPVPYQLDGDPGGFLPLEISVLSERLTFVAPAARVAELCAAPAAPLVTGATT